MRSVARLLQDFMEPSPSRNGFFAAGVLYGTPVYIPDEHADIFMNVATCLVPLIRTFMERHQAHIEKTLNGEAVTGLAMVYHHLCSSTVRLASGQVFDVYLCTVPSHGARFLISKTRGQ